MNAARPGSPGATRSCPHCKATVLESAAICPGCRHHLRFSGAGTQVEAAAGYSALAIEGTVTHQRSNEPCEYSVVVEIRNDRGEPTVRHVIGVGVLQAGETRRVQLSVELTPARAALKPAIAAPAPTGASTSVRPTASGTAGPGLRPGLPPRKP